MTCLAIGAGGGMAAGRCKTSAAGDENATPPADLGADDDERPSHAVTSKVQEKTRTRPRIVAIYALCPTASNVRSKGIC